VFQNADDYSGIDPGDELRIVSARRAVADGGVITVRNVTKKRDVATLLQISERLRGIILDGGVLSHIAK
jgi:hypothetical protein